ncbi:hypothetical protein [Methyloceanibacter marginalis]|nr:hypothetical protein [Methyloceanibacter marginalis]
MPIEVVAPMIGASAAPFRAQGAPQLREQMKPSGFRPVLDLVGP